MAAGAELVADGVVNLGRERALAHARHIGLGDGDDRADRGGSDAGSGGRAAGRGRRRGHKGIGAVIDVEHGALRALEHHAAALGQDVVEHAAGVGDKGAIFSAAAAYSSYIFAGIERIGAEERVGDGVLFRAGGLDVRLEQRRVAADRRRAGRCAPSCPRRRGRCRGWWCRSSGGPARSRRPARSCGGRAE